MQLANRLSRMPDAFWGRRGTACARLEARGVDVIRLDVGSPDLPPTEAIIETLVDTARRPDIHGYSGHSGAGAFREAIASYYQRRFGVSLNPDKEVAPLLGSKEGLAHVALAFVNPDDFVLIPEPAYPIYRQGTYLAGGRVHVVPLLSENDYLPDLETVPRGVLRRARILWLNYPHNPTGATASLDFFTRAVDFARRHDLLLCHDAPYCDVSYERYRPPSILQVPGAKDVALEFNSLSKTYNMAGWRIAMAVGADWAVRGLLGVKACTDSGLFVPLQTAAARALNGDQSWIASRNAIYQERRDLIVSACQELGLSPRKPLAGLYVWAKVPPGYTAEAFSEALLEQQGVSVVPGSMYGQGGEGHIRISVTESTPRIQEGMARLRAFMEKR